jgi:LysM repeat protein
MKPEVHSDTQEIFDNMAEDLAKNRKDDPPLRRQRNSYASGPAGKFTLLVGVGAAILVLFILVIFRGSGKQDLTPLQSRLDQVENRLAIVDDNVRKVQALEDQMKSLQQGQAGLEASGKTVSERLEKLAKQVEKAQALPAAPRAPAQAKTQVHEVRSGDTLFGIAVKYGITLDQLLRLNNLNKNATLQPGQKLLISPGRP